MNFLYFLSGWFLALGFALRLRLLSLRKNFRESEYKKFLDYFENEYLKKSNTFRRKYSYIYNSNIYSIFSNTISVISVILGLVLLVVIFYVDFFA